MALYAFDGTWNREHDQATYDENTNVVKFAKAYNATKAVFQKDGDKMVVVEDNHSFVKNAVGTKHLQDEEDTVYVSGIGTKYGKFGKALGGIFGAGGRTRIHDALRRAEKRFADGDETIDVIGFSRGAALALQFVNELSERAFRNKDGQKEKPRVRFLGLWDVVAAFGVPINVGPIHFQETNLGWHLTLPPIVDHCYHAIALDERRQSFRVTRVAGAYEVWFRGVHSDVGGGNGNEALSNIALAWMLRKAALAGVPVDPAAAIAASKATNPNAKVQHSSFDPRVDPFRKIDESLWMHHTIAIRKEPAVCVDPPDACPRETAAFEENRVRI